MTHSGLVTAFPPQNRIIVINMHFSNQCLMLKLVVSYELSVTAAKIVFVLYIIFRIGGK